MTKAKKESPCERCGGKKEIRAWGGVEDGVIVMTCPCTGQVRRISVPAVSKSMQKRLDAQRGLETDV